MIPQKVKEDDEIKDNNDSLGQIIKYWRIIKHNIFHSLSSSLYFFSIFFISIFLGPPTIAWDGCWLAVQRLSAVMPKYCRSKQVSHVNDANENGLSNECGSNLYLNTCHFPETLLVFVCLTIKYWQIYNIHTHIYHIAHIKLWYWVYYK